MKSFIRKIKKLTKESVEATKALILTKNPTDNPCGSSGCPVVEKIKKNEK